MLSSRNWKCVPICCISWLQKTKQILDKWESTHSAQMYYREREKNCCSLSAFFFSIFLFYFILLKIFKNLRNCTLLPEAEINAEESRRVMLLFKKLHLISIREASPISFPYYSNLSDGREHSREKSNIPRPSTFNISSEDGAQAGGQPGKLNGEISREPRSPPAAIIIQHVWKFDRKGLVWACFISPC